eukprot:scaffold107532_cov35-Phaeocystis_antarctica.AAC.1
MPMRSAGVFALRLHETTVPCSVATRNLPPAVVYLPRRHAVCDSRRSAPPIPPALLCATLCGVRRSAKLRRGLTRGEHHRWRGRWPCPLAASSPAVRPAD